MSETMRIEFEWLALDSGSEIDKALAASIGIAVDEEYVTRLEDYNSRTVRDRLGASAWHLALWFAANWWRLRWEPEPARWWENVDWRLSHSLSAAGGGFVWPNALFSCDGDWMEVVAKPSAARVAYEPIRYINHVHKRIKVSEFEHQIDSFMDAVVARLAEFKLTDRQLVQLWKEVLAERQNPDATLGRKFEAMAGYDADEGPEEILDALIKNRKQFGQNAMEELAAEGRQETSGLVRDILDVSKSKTASGRCGFRGSLPDIGGIGSIDNEDGLPWQTAASIARKARLELGFDASRPIRNKALAEILQVDTKAITKELTDEAVIPFALRTGPNGTFDFHFSNSISTSRRFAISRMIGDHIFFQNEERLIPATHAKTSRQKFQRAFAQEFLCPIDALLEKMQTNQPDEDDISEAAKCFHVSPLLVRTTLVNHNKLHREALSWPD